MQNQTKRLFDTKKIAVAAMLCALAYLAIFVFRFKVSFLTFDFKYAIIAISSLINGPIVGIISAFVVALLEMITVSDTGLYGFIMNFLSTGVFALAVGVIYKYRRSFGGALISAVTAVFSVTAVMLLANLFVTPHFMGTDVSAVVNMLAKLLLPFNLCKALMNASLMLLLYKPLITALRKAKLIKASNREFKFGFKTALLFIGAVITIVLTTLFIILYLEGSFKFI